MWPSPDISSSSTCFVPLKFLRRSSNISGDSSMPSFLKRISSVEGILYPSAMMRRLSEGVGENSCAPLASSSKVGSSWSMKGSTLLAKSLASLGSALLSASDCGRSDRLISWNCPAKVRATSGTPPGTASDAGLLLKDISTARCTFPYAVLEQLGRLPASRLKSEPLLCPTLNRGRVWKPSGAFSSHSAWIHICASARSNIFATFSAHLQ
mmetsp:Transcript_36231/g.61107  ORF Transcript_36231/g.61107 Transcript_36231/m.61107 type:complete len:210 (+) Transcript_36231:389-1018(+)